MEWDDKHIVDISYFFLPRVANSASILHTYVRASNTTPFEQETQ